MGKFLDQQKGVRRSSVAVALISLLWIMALTTWIAWYVLTYRPDIPSGTADTVQAIAILLSSVTLAAIAKVLGYMWGRHKEEVKDAGQH